MEGLPYFQPRDEFGVIQVVPPATRAGGKKNKPLGLDVNAVKRMPVDAAYRELLQNMIDAIVEANGGTFSDICVNQAPDKITFYTLQHILGEIVIREDSISFVNMGPNVTSMEELLNFGGSLKSTKPNQAGQHGEGLKRAALKLLTLGYRVDVFFALNVDQETEFRHIIFKILDQKHCLGYTLTVIDPKERAPGKGDFHRFQVDIQTGANRPAFNIHGLMLLRGIRDSQGQDDPGILLLGDEHKGKMYVYHFFVCSYTKVKYGYDFFLSTVARDRDQIKSNTLERSIAAVWSREIIRVPEIAAHFYQHVVMSDIGDCFEVWAMQRISHDAANCILALFSKEHGAKRPIRASESRLITSQFKSRCFKIVPDHAMALFDLVLPPVEEYLKSFSTTLLREKSMPLSDRVQHVFSDFGSLSRAHRPDLPVNYAVNKTNGLQIVFNMEQERNDDAWWQRLIFRFLPQIFKDYNVEIPNFFDFVQRLANRNFPPLKLRFVSGSDKKRARTEDGDASAPAAVDEGSPPPPSTAPAGYKPYDGPPLFVLK